MLVFYNNIMNKLALPMVQIQAYTLKHLEMVAIVVLAALAFAFLFAKTNVSRSGVIVVFGVLLVLMEIVRQCLYTHLMGGYHWEEFPWQLWSMPMYIALIYPHLRKGKDAAEIYIMTFGLIAAVGSLAIPTHVFYSYLVLTILALVWRGVLLMLSFYLIMSLSKSRSVQVYRPVVLWYLVTAAVAIAINFLTKTVTAGKSHMFFLGPNYPNLYILNAIYGAYGWIVETIAMAVVTLALSFILYFVSGVGKRR